MSKKAREYGYSYIYKHIFLTLTLSADFSIVELWRETGFRFIFIFTVDTIELTSIFDYSVRNTSILLVSQSQKVYFSV